ncbi:uncharacterized protein METZ01_LOCUS255162, partial [marine metagenome]
TTSAATRFCRAASTRRSSTASSRRITPTIRRRCLGNFLSISRLAAWARRRRSPRWRCSSAATRRRSSRAHPSLSMAGRCTFA